MTEQEYHFDSEPKKSGLSGMCNFIWNSNTKEFCGRSGASWAKVSFFYSIFYACLGAFFIGMLAVFFQIMPLDKPTYYGEESTMARKGLNPGLGFRPQIDVEDNLISFNPQVYDNEGTGYKTYFDNLKIFLEKHYSSVDDAITCTDGLDYTNDFNEGKSCEFDYKKIFANTNCTEEKEFGYNSKKVCVLIKMNKIVSWVPKSAEKKVKITCEGQTAVDKDNLKKITFHSENNENADAGYLDAKYFPFMAQKSYRAPFVFAEFDVEQNVLINVVCKAHADNIDNEDSMNLRGMTKFSLFIHSN